MAEVPQGIPLPGVPSLHDVADLLSGALAISVMAFLETVAVARGVRRSTEPQIDGDRELLAVGVASVAVRSSTRCPGGRFLAVLLWPRRTTSWCRSGSTWRSGTGRRARSPPSRNG
ncbi:SulP family inorganic anion transporter [Rhodococcus sp. PAM 2766]|uniref:SulP family inorganic anion transporter n=1 Tax=Rhodococcus parequi TaxID=3137122 RepID=A0ABW9FJ30_9NOCA